MVKPTRLGACRPPRSTSRDTASTVQAFSPWGSQTQVQLPLSLASHTLEVEARDPSIPGTLITTQMVFGHPLESGSRKVLTMPLLLTAGACLGLFIALLSRKKREDARLRDS